MAHEEHKPSPNEQPNGQDDFDREFDRLDAAGNMNAIQIRRHLGEIATEPDDVSRLPEAPKSEPSGPARKSRQVKRPTTARGKMFADVNREKSKRAPFPYGNADIDEYGR